MTGIGGTYTPSAQIVNGTALYVRWADPNDGSNDNALAIDNVNISFAVVPEANTCVLVTLGLGVVGFTRRRHLRRLVKG